MLAAPIVRVEGNAICPRPEELTARVAELLPGSDAANGPDIVHLEDGNPATVQLTLRRPSGEIVGRRALDKNATCADLAAAAAVIVAIWESDVHPEFALRIDPAPPRREPPAPVDLGAAATETGAPGGGPTIFDVGAALFGTVAPKVGTAAGLLLAASWTPGTQTSSARWGIRSEAAGSTEQEQPLLTGTVAWRRLSLAVGPQLRLLSPSRRWIFDVHVAALAAWLNIRGVGFTNNHTDNTVDPGIGAGVRLMLHRGQITPWLALAGTGWLREQVASFGTLAGTSTTLPRLDVMLALGLSFCSCP